MQLLLGVFLIIIFTNAVNCITESDSMSRGYLKRNNGGVVAFSCIIDCKTRFRLT